MNYENGRRLTILGFGLNLLLSIFAVFVYLISDIFNWTGLISILTTYGLELSIGVAAFGFLVMWLSGMKMADLLSCGATGISALLRLLSTSRIYVPFSSIIYLVITSAFYIVLAFRARKFNIMLAMLLGCAFVYAMFSSYFLIDFACFKLDLPWVLCSFVRNAGFVVCDGLCLIEVRMEE